MIELDSTQEQIKIAAQRHFERRAAKSSKEASPLDRADWNEVAELGWIEAAVPASLGGLGGPVETAVLCREFALALSGVPYIEAGVLPATFLAAMAPSDDRLAEVYERVTEGRSVAVAAVGAPGLRFVETGGGAARLQGRATGIIGGQLADHFLIEAPASEVGAPSLVVLVPANMPGLRRTNLPTIDGRIATVLAFADAPLPPDAIVCDSDEAKVALGRARDLAVLGLCAELLAVSERMFELVMEYLPVRRQFGQALADFQALRHRIADLFAECQLGRALLGAALRAFDDDAHERNRMASVCKLRLGTMAKFVGSQAIQVHGAIAMTEEYALGGLYKRSLCIRKTLGDEDFHAARLVRAKVA